MSDDIRAHHVDRYRSLTSDEASLPFLDRLVADSREVALHNIAGLATPDQVQMALFALAYLLPSGRPYIEATRTELADRLVALLAPLGVPAPDGDDSRYYALIDVLAVARDRSGDAAASWLAEHHEPAEVALRLAREHGVIVLPGQIFGAATWDIRISLASLTAPELALVGEAFVALLDALAAESGVEPRD
jgi:aspartate 4-decarboxylase